MYYFQISFNLKVILYVDKVTQNTMIELLKIYNFSSSYINLIVWRINTVYEITIRRSFFTELNFV